MGCAGMIYQQILVSPWSEKMSSKSNARHAFISLLMPRCVDVRTNNETIFSCNILRFQGVDECVKMRRPLLFFRALSEKQERERKSSERQIRKSTRFQFIENDERISGRNARASLFLTFIHFVEDSGCNQETMIIIKPNSLVSR